MKYWKLVSLLALSLLTLFLPAQPVLADEPVTPQVVQARLKAVLTDILTKASPGTKVQVTDKKNDLTLAVHTRKYMVYATDIQTGEIADSLHEEIGPKADGIYLEFQLRETQDAKQAVLPGTYQHPYRRARSAPWSRR